MRDVDSQKMDGLHVPSVFYWTNCKGAENPLYFDRPDITTFRFTRCGTEKSPCPVSTTYKIVDRKFVKI